ncbi:MAG: hypothetical protein B6U68_00415 [Candidatus Aenigmarchaeota archaeon ex4484_14]|nr:MAG: hypothetical protein B6U68_00415 [Candidatus Aenigmarchaeota archaeon ex4484_14]
MRRLGLSIIFILTMIAILVLSHAAPNALVVITGNNTYNNYWVNATTNATYNFSITNPSGNNNVTEINISVPFDGATKNFTVYNSSIGISLANWSCEGYNTTGPNEDNISKIVCSNTSSTPLLGPSQTVYIWFNATAEKTGEINQTWNITTIDNNSAVNSTTVTTGIDTIAPSLTLKNITHSKWGNITDGDTVNGVINITINVSDNGSGLKSASLRFSNATFNSSWFSFTFNSLGNSLYWSSFDTNLITNNSGTYNLSIRAYDNVGNVNLSEDLAKNILINNTITLVEDTNRRDATAVLKSGQNTWGFFFNITYPANCTLKVKMADWTTTASSGDTTISVSNVKIYNSTQSGGFSIANTYSGGDEILLIDKDNDASNGIQANFTANITVPLTSAISSSWTTTYGIACQ